MQKEITLYKAPHFRVPITIERSNCIIEIRKFVGSYKISFTENGVNLFKNKTIVTNQDLLYTTKLSKKTKLTGKLIFISNDLSNNTKLSEENIGTIIKLYYIW